MDDHKKREAVPLEIQRRGGLKRGVAEAVSQQTGVPAADVFGVGSFFHLLQPEVDVRICSGLSCALKGSEDLLKAAQDCGLSVDSCSCLAACDEAPAALLGRRVEPGLSLEAVQNCEGDWTTLVSRSKENWRGIVGPEEADSDSLAINLVGARTYEGTALRKAVDQGSAWVLDELEASGLQGRGGAGFPAHIKWRAVQRQPESTRYLVLNADEGEPGTFKDREVLMRRPDRVIEGLAIAARTLGMREIYLYVRGEMEIPKACLQEALDAFAEGDLLEGLTFHFHDGQGAYICGEETALIEALEGRRGMPRLRPPYPVEFGFRGKPTLVHNVETIACLPAILERDGAWFKALGRKEAGTKLYSISGNVNRPGVYEMPLGTTLDELVLAAGGYEGELKAFSPGGASSGFLPAEERHRPLSFGALGEVGSMLGSGGVVVLNQDVPMPWAAYQQLCFFEAESCGQCAPCRLGTRFLRESLERAVGAEDPSALQRVDQASNVMAQGSICGLGQAAFLPLTTARKYFPEEFPHE